MCRFNCNQGKCKTGAPHYCGKCGALDQHRKTDCPTLKTTSAIVICVPVYTSVSTTIILCGLRGCTERHNTHKCRNCQKINLHKTTNCTEPCRSCGRVTSETKLDKCNTPSYHVTHY
jgi:hypothetical protein